MRLTTKGRYAVTALLDIAIQQSDTPTTVQQLASRHGISKAYLERLTGIMRSEGLLKSVKGPGGGYVLGKEAAEISISDIIEAVKEPVDATRCQGKADCQDGVACLGHHLWVELNQKILGFLKNITLHDLAHRPDLIQIANRQCNKNMV